MMRTIAKARVGFAATAVTSKRFTSVDAFASRHIGNKGEAQQAMLQTLGHSNIEEMMQAILPPGIARPTPMKDVPAMSETQALKNLSNIMGKNKILKSMIGHGYYEAITPPVILRNVLENPNWYTPYTPYQAEISQGRIESLLNYQTVITDMVKMDVSNASLLDQATAAGEAMYLAYQTHKHKKHTFFVDKGCFPSVIEMVRTRAYPIGVKVVVGSVSDLNLADPDLCGLMVQTPDATGALHDYTELFAKARATGVVTSCNADLLACAIIKPAGDMGADCVVGSAQRFGIPLGYGGPHAAFFAVRDEHKRVMPGRLIGVSKDRYGKVALRMALQTREQHIKREKATSNICTAQALLANMSAMYAVYHGPQGIKEIAEEIHGKAKVLATGLAASKNAIVNQTFFDTITFRPEGGATEYANRCVEKGINVFVDEAANTVSVSIDEATTEAHIVALLEAAGVQRPNYSELAKIGKDAIPEGIRRTSTYLTQRVFNELHSEHEMMRYIHRLARKDYGLTHGSIPLGSCTMKLNPAASMLPLSWPSVGNMHPMVPANQARGYEAMCLELTEKLKDITGFAAVSLQPNSGANGEYAGLRAIRAYHESRGDHHRNICLIPQSAHGTNPASAVLGGMDIVIVACRKDGAIDLVDLEAKIKKHEKNLSCIMVTYPSTYGLYDKDIKELCSMVHAAGGQVYIDGANLNAHVGYTGPAFVGGDVCHMNMHKTFSIPHGGGGPGMGPIAVAEHLAPFLPNSVFGAKVGGSKSFGQVSQASYGSASILTISYMLMCMLGSDGLKACTANAVLNANYLKKRLENDYIILYKDEKGYCGHEFIIDLRPFKKSAGLEAEDIAKRLMDYGFHAPTLAFPVPGTLMIEPTESESKKELDRLADALISIRKEIRDIEEGKQPIGNNVVSNSPHTVDIVTAETWSMPYSREQAAFPTEHTKADKFWPTVSRIDGAFGDRNLICSCGGIEDYVKAANK